MGLKKGKYGEANFIKAELIDFLLKHAKYELMINELPFLCCKRSADLVAINNGMSIGFEIKSKYDNLKTMLDQISDYRKTFNFVYLVYSCKFAKSKELTKLPKNIGLIVISSDNKLILKRKARKKISLDKTSMTSVLWRKDLEKLLPKYKKSAFEQLKQRAIEECTTANIQNQIIISLQGRYGDGYKLFLKEKGQKVILEDLNYITNTKKHPVVFSNINTAWLDKD